MNPKNSFLHMNYPFLPIIILLTLYCIILSPNTHALAADKNYGIMIGDVKGNYTYYDFNSSSTSLEISSNGKAMLSAWSFASKMPSIKYSFNKSTNTATLINIANGKKLIFKKNEPNCTYYKSNTAKPVIKKLATPMYISPTSSSVMVPASALAWLMPASGYQYMEAEQMQEKGYDTLLFSGTFIYQPYQKITSIPDALNVKGLSHTIQVTIPEGYSVSEIFDLLVKKGVCTSIEKLYTACETYNFNLDRYPLIREIKANENRSFRLEGYLFPDTYEFYRMSSGEDAIGVFLRNTEQKITAEYRTSAAELGYTMDQILTIASIIEKECGVSSEQANISAVIHNRLHNNQRLQMDATSIYIDRRVKPFITGDIDRYSGYYNTYKCNALPAGPICNPGIRAIKAALNPSNASYLYFYSDRQGNYYFSNTYEEHLKNVALYGSKKEELTSNT